MSNSALVAQDLSVHFGTREVLSEVTFAAERGEIVALLGPNGAGKTTLLRSLAGLASYSGTVLVAGQDLKSLTASERAKKLAYVPQKSQLTAPMPVWDVVALGRYSRHRSPFHTSSEDHGAIEQALLDVQAEGLRARPFNELSGGEQRRVLLARALATGADIILLDEPTSALDVRYALGFLELLQSLSQKGHLIIAALHQLDEARRYTTRTLLLHQGRVLAAGSSQDVIEKDFIFQAYGVHLVAGAGLGFQLPQRG